MCSLRIWCLRVEQMQSFHWLCVSKCFPFLQALEPLPWAFTGVQACVPSGPASKRLSTCSYGDLNLPVSKSFSYFWIIVEKPHITQKQVIWKVEEMEGREPSENLSGKREFCKWNFKERQCQCDWLPLSKPFSTWSHLFKNHNQIL